MFFWTDRLPLIFSFPTECHRSTWRAPPRKESIFEPRLRSTNVLTATTKRRWCSYTDTGNENDKSDLFMRPVGGTLLFLPADKVTKSLFWVVKKKGLKRDKMSESSLCLCWRYPPPTGRLPADGGLTKFLTDSGADLRAVHTHLHLLSSFFSHH